MIVVVAVLLLAGCDRSGLSSKFRRSAEHAFEVLAKADEAMGPADMTAADQALAETKALAENAADLRMAEALDWYSILVRRRDRERTKDWRQLCAREVQLYLTGDSSGSVRISGEDRRVDRGTCQKSAFQMMNEDCVRTGRPADSCSFGQ
jgi:hypothetical protein